MPAGQRRGLAKWLLILAVIACRALPGRDQCRRGLRGESAARSDHPVGRSQAHDCETSHTKTGADVCPFPYEKEFRVTLKSPESINLPQTRGRQPDRIPIQREIWH